MLDFQNVTVTDVCGTRLTSPNTVQTVVRHYEEGQALFVSATAPTGLLGEGGIVLSFAALANQGYVAIENHSPFWCRPFFGNSLKELPERVQMLLLKLESGAFRCYLPVCADTFKTVLRGSGNGFDAVMNSCCDGLTVCDAQLALITSEGEEPFEVLRDCASLAVKLLDNGLSLREDKEMPEIFQYLGWCSWDAMQYRLSERGLLEKAREFKEKSVPVRFAILDDMWGDVPNLKAIPEEHTFREMVSIMHDSRLRSFDADPERFPNGMKGAIDALKQAGIPNVGLWYPTTGYWKGLEHDCELVLEHPENFIVAKGGKWHTDDQNILLVKPEAACANAYFDTLAERAREWGIDFIKVDHQGCHLHYKNLYPIGQSARAIQHAIDASASRYFNGALINCMGMPSECMFNRPQSAVSRCSDDFMPESREWFSKNILQCAYNGLLQGQFYINDWDMWWTDDEQAVKNSLCRAISGGPVYISDQIGRTRPEVLKPLSLLDGRLLLPDGCAMPCEDCLVTDPTKSGEPLKIFNRVGRAGIVAAFNVDAHGRAVNGNVSALDAQMPSRDCVCYEYFTGECISLNADESIPVQLDHNDVFRLYVFVPRQRDGVTVFGRCDKFIGVKAIQKASRETVELIEGGRLGFYTKTRVRVFSDKRELLVKYKKGLSYVDAHADETVLHFRYL